ncbi:MAG TPA: hypothetical protein DEB06_05465 [Phycisphaerales bacterium]|nr:hypothetical protein [Phycisphaerales bacterium]
MAQIRRHHPVYAQHPSAVAAPAVGPRGFSLIDLLVSIAVLVVLISLLAPGLQQAHERARRVKCAAHMRQVSYAIQMFADDHRGKLPEAVFGRSTTKTTPRQRTNPTPLTAGDTIHLRLGPAEQPPSGGPDRAHATSAPDRWDGLGVLHVSQYVTNPGVFYCPSHHGQHPHQAYVDRWVNQKGRITGNFQYRVPAESSYIAEIQPTTTIIADGMQTKLDYNHVVGNNYVQADLSLAWFSDDDGSLYRSLPEPVSLSSGGGRNTSPWDILDERKHDR